MSLYCESAVSKTRVSADPSSSNWKHATKICCRFSLTLKELLDLSTLASWRGRLWSLSVRVTQTYFWPYAMSWIQVAYKSYSPEDYQTTWSKCTSSLLHASHDWMSMNISSCSPW